MVRKKIPSEISFLKVFFEQLQLAQPDSHKGQNGKLLIIGGSELFHAASKWSLDVASRLVDMVFYSSVPSNNELIKIAKTNFWNGIIIEREHITDYLEEADCVLIGPGMTRTPDTAQLVNSLLQQFPAKKWVIDAGALQMVQPNLFSEQVIITPHQGELERVLEKLPKTKTNPLKKLLQTGVTVLLKGQTDHIYQAETQLEITGGNPGMTKGGTGDVLAGLVAGLYATNEALTAAVIASYVNKKTGDELYKTVGPFFNSTDLAAKVPAVLWESYQLLKRKSGA